MDMIDDKIDGIVNDIKYFEDKLLKFSRVPKEYYQGRTSSWDVITEDNGFSEEKAIAHCLHRLYKNWQEEQWSKEEEELNKMFEYNANDVKTVCEIEQSKRNMPFWQRLWFSIINFFHPYK